MGARYEDWIGREEIRHERICRQALHRLDALLDRPANSADPGLPPLGHWLMFLPDAPQALLRADGHPMRADFYPTMLPPMRMWAGCSITFHMPIPVEAQVTRRMSITAIREKAGRSGPLVFVTTRSVFGAGSDIYLEEDLELVFRDRSAGGGAPPQGEQREADFSRTIEPTSALLFRFSALTFNAHRIHYDRDYAHDVEGYPGLVVHGPLLATLLMDHFCRWKPGAVLRAFSVRAQRPVYDLAPFTVNLKAAPDGADLWANDADGFAAMSGRIEVQQ